MRQLTRLAGIYLFDLFSYNLHSKCKENANLRILILDENSSRENEFQKKKSIKRLRNNNA